MQEGGKKIIIIRSSKLCKSDKYRWFKILIFKNIYYSIKTKILNYNIKI